jgi:flagellar hook assembly protein FlgD
MTVGNFSMSMNVTQFNGSAGGGVTYTSVIPFALSETITIKNAAGQTVRTLFSGSRAAGTFTDVWNGRDAQASLLPDGPYFYTASAAAGSSSMVWDLGGVYSTLPNSFFCQAWVPVTNFQPFNNRFLPLSYNLSIPARTWVLFSVGWYDCNTPGPPLSACADPDKFCFPNGEYQESGLHSGWWAGVDPAGAFRGNIGSIAVLARQDNFSRNAVVLFGSKPGLTNLVVQPTAFNPGFGAQSVAFDVSSFQNQPLNVSVSAKNQESLSVLRTVTAAAQPAGHVTVLWDGRADNGMWAAPGAYTLTVTVSDAIGNAVSRQALTSISY